MMPDPLVDIDPNEPFFHQLVDVRNGRLREGLPAPRILWPVAEGPSPSSSEQTAVEEGSADQQTVLTDEASEDAQGSGEGEEGEH